MDLCKQRLWSLTGPRGIPAAKCISILKLGSMGILKVENNHYGEWLFAVKATSLANRNVDID